jgi:two-component system chemotaxis response regulator CheB
MADSRIKVLVGDNSSFVRVVMSDILNSDPDIRVIDTAVNGEDLIAKTKMHRPDVIVFDTEISKSERHFTMKRIMNECPTPMVMSGCESKLNQKAMLEFRKIGANYFVIRPARIFKSELRTISDDIILKVKSAVNFEKQQVAVVKVSPFSSGIPAAFSSSVVRRNVKKARPSHVIVIGSSTGGPAAVEQIIKNLSPDFPAAVLIAQHMPIGFTRTFANRLNSITSLNVEEGEHGMLIEAGKIYIAPGNHNMIVSSVMGVKDNFRIEFAEGDCDSFDKPSIDMLMQSVAAAYGNKAIGVMLTGLGRDGTIGSRAIYESGGIILAQDEASSVVYGLAKSAIEEGCVHRILPLAEISGYLSTLVNNLKVN